MNMRKKLLAFVFAVAVGIAVFAAVGMLSSPQRAEASHKVVVTISGGLTLPDGSFPLHVQARVSGPAAALTGQGSDSPRGKGYCRFPLTGSVDLATNVVTLSGVTTFTNDPSIGIGIPVTLVADASDGSITWTFDLTVLGPLFPFLTFEGTGSVVIAHR